MISYASMSCANEETKLREIRGSRSLASFERKSTKLPMNNSSEGIPGKDYPRRQPFTGKQIFENYGKIDVGI